MHVFVDILKILPILCPLNLNSRSFPRNSFTSCSPHLSECKPQAQNHQSCYNINALVCELEVQYKNIFVYLMKLQWFYVPTSTYFQRAKSDLGDLLTKYFSKVCGIRQLLLLYFLGLGKEKIYNHLVLVTAV